MSQADLLCFIAAAFAGLISLRAIICEHKTFATWCLAAGMAILSAESLFAGLGAGEILGADVAHQLNWRWSCTALLPCVWLCFSVTYARAEYAKSLTRWRVALAISFILPVGAVLACGQRLVEFRTLPGGEESVFGLTTAGKVLNFLFLPSAILVLSNLEQTFRASVGIMRWRIKFMVIGAGVLFAARAYTSSQMLLYSTAIQPSSPIINSGGLILGCALIFCSFFRGPSEVDVYVSPAAPHRSLTLLIAGVYLVGAGLLANLMVWLGAATGVSGRSLIILGALAMLAVVLVSDRARLYARQFISRSFERPLYDYRTVWRDFTQGTASRLTEDELCNAAVKLTAQVLQVLSVTVWLVDDKLENLIFGASTSLSNAEAQKLQPTSADSTSVIRALLDRAAPVDIAKSTEPWALALRNCQPAQFQTSGGRVGVPMIAGGELLGVMLLADRVGGVPFSVQDFDLLKCVADQVAAGLLNSRLSRKLLQAKEMEAFQTMSAFFVHDLKNTANTLNLMLKNLPVHFENPAFREDALRAITKSGQHINQLIGRLSVLRHDMQIHPVETDLNDVVNKALSNWTAPVGISLFKDLGGLRNCPWMRTSFKKCSQT